VEEGSRRVSSGVGRGGNNDTVLGLQVILRTIVPLKLKLRAACEWVSRIGKEFGGWCCSILLATSDEPDKEEKEENKRDGAYYATCNGTHIRALRCCCISRPDARASTSSITRSGAHTTRAGRISSKREARRIERSGHLARGNKT